MPNSVCEVLLTENKLENHQSDADFASGAIVEFFGVVRQFEDGREIEGIDYEAHASMANHQLSTIAEEAGEKFRVRKVCIQHRTGFVPCGEASLFMQVRAAHRGAAFAASQWMVDELKKRVPIWKKPRFALHAKATDLSGRTVRTGHDVPAEKNATNHT